MADKAVTEALLVHRAPNEGTGPLQCCGEMPSDQLMTHARELVTCPGRPVPAETAQEVFDGVRESLSRYLGYFGPEVPRQAAQDPTTHPEYVTLQAAATLLRHSSGLARLLGEADQAPPLADHPRFRAVADFARKVGEALAWKTEGW